MSGSSQIDTKALSEASEKAKEKFIEAMDDDFNTSLALAEIFELVSVINSQIGNSEISEQTAPAVSAAREMLINLMNVFGISFEEKNTAANDDILEKIAEKFDIDLSQFENAEDAILQTRADARKNKN